MLDLLPVEQRPPWPESELSAGQERPARASLLAQIERLEGKLTELVCCDRWRGEPEEAGGPRQGARLLSLGELEAIRDRLVDRVGEGRADVSARTEAQEAGRRLRESMLLEPGRHRWVRVTNKQIGEPGCLSWHVRPRLGPDRDAHELVAGGGQLRLSVAASGPASSHSWSGSLLIAHSRRGPAITFR